MKAFDYRVVYQPYLAEIENRPMTISVIIPAYNGAATIANAIESILRQTRPPDEIIVSRRLQHRCDR